MTTLAYRAALLGRERVVGQDVEQDVGVEQRLAELAERLDRRDVALVHLPAREEQRDLGVRAVAAVDRRRGAGGTGSSGRSRARAAGSVKRV